MPWKEGVTEEDVKRFHEFIEACSALENQVYDGTLTPQEAKDQVLKYAETLSHPPVNKPGEPPTAGQLPEFPPVTKPVPPEGPEGPTTLPVPPPVVAPKKNHYYDDDDNDHERTAAPKKK